MLNTRENGNIKIEETIFVVSQFWLISQFLETIEKGSYPQFRFLRK